MNKAFQSFTLPPNVTARSIAVELDVFNPNINCVIADTTLLANDMAIRLETSTCTVGSAQQAPLGFNSTACSGMDCPPQQMEPSLFRVNCLETTRPSATDEIDLDATDSYDIRYALVVSNVTYDYLSAEGFTIAHRKIQNTSAVICKVDYSVDHGFVSYDYEYNKIMIESLAPGAPLQNLTGFKLGEIIYASLYDTKNLLLKGVSIYDSKRTFRVETPLFHVLLQTLQGEQVLNKFLDPVTLQRAATQTLSGIAAQVFKQRVLQPAAIQTIAQRQYTEDRLHITPTSLWSIFAIALLLAVIPIYVCFAMKRDLVPQNPTLIASHATILAASPSARDLFRGAGIFRTGQLKALLDGYEFRSMPGERFTIEAVKFEAPHTDDAKVKTHKPPWLPLAARWYMLAATFAGPIFMIVALEIAYQQSQKNVGIADVTGIEDRALGISHNLSAFLMLLIATCFNNLDFTIALFAPYSLLRSGAVPASRSVKFHLLGQLPIVALWKSISQRHFASALSSLSSLAGSILTIVVSGLWIVDREAITRRTVRGTISDTWDINWYNSSSTGDGGAGTQLDQIQHGGAAFPNTILSGYVLPTVNNITWHDGDVIDDDTSPLLRNLTLQVDGLQPILNCSLVADEAIRIDFSKDDSGRERIIVEATPLLPPGCRHAGPDGTDDFYDFKVGGPTPLSGAGPIWIGAFYDLHLGPYYSARLNPTLGYGEDYFTRTYQRDNPAGCPSIGVIYAQGSRNMTKNDVTALLCSQQIQQSRLNVAYIGNQSSKADTSIAPLVSGNQHFLDNGTEGFDTFPYRPQQYLTTDTGNLTRFVKNDETQELDEFMNQIVYGPDGSSLVSLSGVANRDNLVQGVQRLYSKYMSLVIDSKFRRPLDANADPIPANGFVLMSSSRLQMHYNSKLALQLLLVIMAILGLLAFLLQDLRGTLPRKPTTIASTMAFLADSEICSARKRLLPARAEWMSEKEIDRIMHGWLFSLGWWPSRDKCADGDDDGDSVREQKQLIQLKEVSGRQNFPSERHFGVDVGTPEQLGYRETRWWRVRRRVGRTWTRIEDD
jgi:hypothetical protein